MQSAASVPAAAGPAAASAGAAADRAADPSAAAPAAAAAGAAPGEAPPAEAAVMLRLFALLCCCQLADGAPCQGSRKLEAVCWHHQQADEQAALGSVGRLAGAAAVEQQQPWRACPRMYCAASCLGWDLHPRVAANIDETRPMKADQPGAEGRAERGRRGKAGVPTAAAKRPSTSFHIPREIPRHTTAPESTRQPRRPHSLHFGARRLSLPAARPQRPHTKPQAHHPSSDTRAMYTREPARTAQKLLHHKTLAPSGTAHACQMASAATSKRLIHIGREHFLPSPQCWNGSKIYTCI